MARRTGGLAALPPGRKWRAITIATLVLVPGFWAMLAAGVAAGSEEQGGVSNPAAAFAFGFALIPFSYLALAFLSEHPSAPSAVLKAMGLCLPIGIVVSAIAIDAVTGLVAGVGAGGVVALRADDPHTWRARAAAVAVAAIYTFVLARAAGALVLLTAPIFPFTGIGVVDHLAERRADRDRARTFSR